MVVLTQQILFENEIHVDSDGLYSFQVQGFFILTHSHILLRIKKEFTYILNESEPTRRFVPS